MNNLAIIPARSGSKGLPDKNIKCLNGIPLMAYSIRAAIKSNLFSEIIVSTDSTEYAKIAQEFGASVPFLRSKNTSEDTSSSWDMVKEVLNCYKKIGKHFETVCLLQPTSPLRTAYDIAKAYELYNAKSAIAVLSVCEMEHTPLWSNTLPADNSLKGFIKRENGGRRQDRNTFYRLNGAIYIVNVNELYVDTYFYRDGSYAYIMPADRSIDIDTATDFAYAEFLIHNQYKSDDYTYLF